MKPNELLNRVRRLGPKSPDAKRDGFKATRDVDALAELDTLLPADPFIITSG